MNRQIAILQKYEDFLANIPLNRYREELMPIKTVEQDLPKNLNPLTDIYREYWDNPNQEYKSYDDFFNDWWKSHLTYLDDFISKYFWGCSRDFVFLGFKARIYRTLISILTQFHFALSWKAYCQSPLVASPDLDIKGVDALVEISGCRIGLQVKKETYRPEASSGQRFAPRGLEVDIMVEVPYTIAPMSELKLRQEKARTERNRKIYAYLYFASSRLQRTLKNGFIVFDKDYPIALESILRKRVPVQQKVFLHWDEVLALVKEHLE